MSSQSAAPAKEQHLVSLLDATLIQSLSLSPSAYHLTFRVETPGENQSKNAVRLEFLPGQSVRIEVPGSRVSNSNSGAANPGSSSVPLACSIASVPREDNCFELCLKRGSQGSPADRLCDLNEGMRIRCSRPAGAFVLNEPAGDTVFLASGTGIAPIRSMLHWLLQQHGRSRASRIWLVFGARDSESLFFDHEFRHLAGQHSNFHYIPTLSRPDSSWDGACGYVQGRLQDLLQHLSPSTRTAHMYVCGPAAMVSSVRSLLHQHGWPEELIHYERHDF